MKNIILVVILFASSLSLATTDENGIVLEAVDPAVRQACLDISNATVNEYELCALKRAAGQAAYERYAESQTKEDLDLFMEAQDRALECVSEALVLCVSRFASFGEK